jgi:hypothetical protein
MARGGRVGSGESDSMCEVVDREIAARPMRRVTVKGRKREFMVYELLGIASSDDPELAARAEDGKLSELTWAASDCFERGDVAGAARQYREILRQLPDDPLATVRLRELSESLQPETPGQGVEELGARHSSGASFHTLVDREPPARS